jgi:protein-disulfide isomerase
MARPTRRLLTAVALIGVTAAFACAAAASDSAKGAKKTPAADAAARVAQIGDKSITMQELDAEAAGSLSKVRQEEYEVRRQALDGMINKQLLDKEAAAKGVEVTKLLETEVVSKVADPKPEEIDALYEQNKARYGSQPKEQVVAQLGNMMRAQKSAEVRNAYLKTLRDKYGVKILLDPPRVAVSLDDDAAKGPAKAPVTIVEFSDYQCPYCGRAEQTVQEILKRYGDKVRLVYRDYPLPMHPNALGAAEASECAKEQGKFWEMHGAMFANQAKLSQADLVATAGSLGLDKDKFKTCLDSGKYKDEVQKDAADGQSYGVTGTPTFFINGIMLVGARPLDSFSEIIDDELARGN